MESANFEPVNIRKTSQKLGLKTGASVGFENEISPELVQTAMERVISLIQEISRGKVARQWIDFYPQKIKENQISFRVGDVSKSLGVAIPEKEIFSILKRLGFETKKIKEAIFVEVPAERLDLVQKEDVIEEIARIYGYQKIPSLIPEGLLIPASRNDNYFYENVIRDLLVSAGFSEVYNYSFNEEKGAEIENPISSEKKYLRTNLLAGLTKTARENFRYFNEVRIFEIGKIFRLSGKKILEKNMLASLVAYKDERSHVKEFSEIKGVLEMMFSKLGISDFWFEEHPSRTAGVKIAGEEIGIIENGGFEIDLKKLVGLISEEIEYRPVSKYPAVIRDIALLVPPKAKMVEVLDVIENAGGSLLIDTDLFDVYEGEEVKEGRKNFAFHLIFQSPEKTLSDKEVNALVDKIIKALEANPEWEVRK